MDQRTRRGRSGDPRLDLAVLNAPVLVVNPGSTSLKLSVVRGDESTEVESLETAPPDVMAVAHRVVHGGDRFRYPVVVDDEIEAALRGLVELAPIHNLSLIHI